MKKIKNLNYLDLTIVYALSILFLYLLQDILYGRAIDTLVKNLAIVIILVPTGSIYTNRKLLDEDRNGVRKSKAEKKYDNIKLLLLIGIFLISSVYGLVNNIYYLVSWQLLIMVVVMIIWEYRRRKNSFANKEIKEEVIFGIVVLLMINIVTVIYLVIMQPVTVLTARSDLEKFGYTDVKYIEHQSDEETILGNYLFEVSTDSKDIYMTYDVRDKTIRQLN